MNCDVNFEPNGQALFKTFHNSLSLNYKNKIKLPRPLRKRFGLGCSLQVIMPYHGTFINDCFTIAFSGAITRRMAVGRRRIFCPISRGQHREGTSCGTTTLQRSKIRTSYRTVVESPSRYPRQGCTLACRGLDNNRMNMDNRMEAGSSYSRL